MLTIDAQAQGVFGLTTKPAQADVQRRPEHGDWRMSKKLGLHGRFEVEICCSDEPQG